MKISLNALKKYLTLPADLTTSQLVELIGSRLVEVEEVIDLAPKYQGAHIVKVVSCQPIPDTHLHLCQIDAGEVGRSFASQDSATSGTADSDRPLVQVVCGAPNVYTGMLTVWLAPDAIVPVTYGQENFKLSVRKLRGHQSFGMLAGPDELDFGDEHGGIVELAPNAFQPGDNFADKFDLNDIILDIENKSLTHRPDTFGLIGFAREVAGILGQKFTSPEFFFVNDIDLITKDLVVTIEDAELCPRYTCAVLELSDANFKNPYLTPADVFLFKSGMRPVSKIVDLTNIIMLQTGQPLHAFDFDKFLQVGRSDHPHVLVRAAREGETMTLLDGKTITCDQNDILITSNDQPVALAGAMGAANTAIDQSTRRILLESATFSLYHLRKTQMKHGIFSEAITRFTKGQPAGMTFTALAEIINQLGIKPQQVVDQFAIEPRANFVTVSLSAINQLLGTNYSAELVKRTLENVGFTVEQSSSPADLNFTITAPYWRTDIQIKEDIIEEVGRLLGFDNITPTLPLRPFIGANFNPLLKLKTTLRQLLSDQLQAHEVLTYSFVHRDLLTKANLSPEDCYQIANSISPELQFFRPAIIPSLLEKTYENLRAGHQGFSLYEFNQITRRSYGLSDDQVPKLRHQLALVSCGDYYQVAALLRHLCESLFHLSPTLQAVEQPSPYFEPLHTAQILLPDSTSQLQVVGYLGEIQQHTCQKLKLPLPTAAFELDLELLLKVPTIQSENFILSKFPTVERDLTLKVSTSAAFLDFSSVITEQLATHTDFGDLTFHLDPLSIYQSDPATKNLSFRLRFASLQKTLNNQEISAIMEAITTKVSALGAQIV